MLWTMDYWLAINSMLLRLHWLSTGLVYMTESSMVNQRAVNHEGHRGRETKTQMFASCKNTKSRYEWLHKEQLDVYVCTEQSLAITSGPFRCVNSMIPERWFPRPLPHFLELYHRLLSGNAEPLSHLDFNNHPEVNLIYRQ